MEAAESAPHDVVKKVRSWIPRRSESPAMSRDYWMPDSSCPVCYECDSQFNLFNRRHHCRICGRIFCGKCTQNKLSTADGCTGFQEEGERVRVCKFCFNHREQDAVGLNGRQPSTPTLTPSASSRSLASNSTSDSSTASSGYPGLGYASFGFRTHLVNAIDSVSDNKQHMMIRPGRRSDRSVSPRGREGSPSPYDFCSNRSDDDDEEYHREAECHDLRIHEVRRHDRDEEEDDSCVEMDTPDTAFSGQPSDLSPCRQEYTTKTVADCNDGGNQAKSVDIKSPSCQNIGTVEQSLSKRSGMSAEYYEGPEEGADDNNFDTSLYQDPLYPQPSNEGEQPVDVENNALIWVPPPPEDEEDENGISMADDDDDDDDDAEGGWGLPRSSGSLSSSECRNREKAASEEQRKAMRAVVDGHFRVLVAQLLNGAGIQTVEDDRESWLEIVTALSLQAATVVKPDTSRGGGMDPGGYVKVKCVATGRRSESYVVKGIVCKKNVAHRRMKSWCKNPRLLLLGGALEYQRVSNQLSSLDTLLQQEMDHLSMAVARIEAHHPDVLLVEKAVSRHAQERLLAKEISLVLNVKRPLLERIARCTGASIVPNPDHLAPTKSTKVGHCELFHVEKYVEEHGSACQGRKKLPKTLMFFEGCPKPLGCTILLKGANGDELKKVKNVAQFAVFAAYHLALETSFLVDEGANLPELCLKSPISVALPDKQSKSDRSISTVAGFLAPTSLQAETGNSQIHEVRAVQSTGMPVSCSNSTLNLGDSGLKEPSVVASTPWSAASLRASSTTNSPCTSPQTLRTQEARMNNASTKPFTTAATSSRLHEVIGPTKGNLSPAMDSGDSEQRISNLSVSLTNGYLEKISTYGPLSACGGSVFAVKTNGTPASEVSPKTPLRASCRSPSPGEGHGLDDIKGQLEKVDTNTSQEPHLALQIKSQDGEDQKFSQEDFPPSPSDHQSILVSFSSSCLRKRTVCERGHLFRIKYYGTFDKPLGRFLRDTIFDPNYRCKNCDEPKSSHVDCYTHRQGSLTISVHRQRVLPGEMEGKIWMWHRCLKCARIDGVPPATRRLVMSDAAWGLSFGKFLELSFSNHAAASRVAACGHSLHRDCLRFYGFGSMVACFRYAPVNIYSVCLPPSKLEFYDPKNHDWLKKEVIEVTYKGELVFAEVFNGLRRVGVKIASYGSGKVPEARRRIAELESLSQKQKAGFEVALEKAAPMKYQQGQPPADILELNRLRRGLAICSSAWDNRLQDLECSLKSWKPTTASDSILFGDPFVLLLKDASYGSSNSRSTVSQEIHAGMDTNIDSSILMQIQGTGSSLDGGTMHSSDTVQSKDQSEKTKAKNANESVLEDVEGTAKPCNDSSMANRLLDSGSVGTVLRRVSNEGNSWLEGALSLSEDKMEDTSGHGIEPPLAEGVEDRLLISSNLPESNSGPVEERIGASSEVLDVEIGVHRNLLEGQFPALPDLSDTFEAAWTGKGQIVEGHVVHIAANSEEIPLKAGAVIVAIGGESTIGSKGLCSEVSDKGSTENHPSKLSSKGFISSQESGGTWHDLPLASTLTSPAKAGEPSDIEGWVGAPYSSLCRPYSRTSQSSLTGSPPRADAQLLSSSPFVVSHAGQAAAQGEARISLPVGINETVIAVYDDEPTSIIAYAIISQEHQAHLSDRPVEKDKQKDKEREQKEKAKERESGDPLCSEGVMSHPLQLVEGSLEQVEMNFKDTPNNPDENTLASSKDGLLDDPLLYSKAMHIKVSFTDDSLEGKVKYTVTCYYAKQFDALRKKCCPSEMEFIGSLCRCKKWGAQGGKSNVFFAKTADDRFVVKQVTKTELESFITFAPAYFKYLSDALISGSPTCLAKILGIFQVIVKHGKGGKEVRMDLMVMDNLLYGRHVTRIYDLKGSLRSRYNADAGKDSVLLDQNLLESMQTNPIFISNKAKRLLERAVWNDTSFLASVDVMDYSLLVGIDEERQDLVLGIIDFMRQYTWDKHLETWVKASGILGGPKNATPTVISPMQYKKRFRKAMSTYFLMVPDQWSPPTVVSGPPQVDSVDESSPVAMRNEAVDDTSSLKV